MKVAGYPFWARALETVCSSCVLVTADDVRACAREYKVHTTAILWARGDGKKNLGTCLCVWVFCSCHIYGSIWVVGDKDMHLGKQVVLQILSPG